MHLHKRPQIDGICRCKFIVLPHLHLKMEFIVNSKKFRAIFMHVFLFIYGFIECY